ncbi:MAG: hypothetical protein KC621_33045, partial [Myxococcales bacterium]|nr:hypothetical protein [Myxococcales bacterium]
MRPYHLTPLTLFLASQARAGEAWPTTWIPTGLADPSDTSPSSADLLDPVSVLDVAETPTTVFFRIRLEGDPLAANGNWDNFAWQILIESDGDTSDESYDQMVYFTSSGAEEFVIADNTSSTGQWCADEPETTLFSYSTVPGDVLDEVPDPQGGGYYLLMQVPMADWYAATGLTTVLGAPYAVGTSSTHQQINKDATANCADPWSTIADADEDGDGLTWDEEAALGTDPDDADSDDHGLSDGDEATGTTDPTNPDSDGDGVQDGTELGLTAGTPDTDPGVFVPDADPSTTTDPALADTDGDALSDGEEDV